MKIASPNSIPKRIIHFIKYHNAFVIGLVFVFLISASVFAASPQARDAVTGKEVTKKGIDNSALLATNFSNFDQNLKIKSVKEDKNKYYLTYTYHSLAVENHRWQKVKKKGKLDVHKKALQGADLGIYAAEELSDVAQADLRKLKKIQKKQEKKGLTHAKETTEYKGLAGLVLNPKTEELPGYEPVKEKTDHVVQANNKATPEDTSQQASENQSNQKQSNQNATPTDKQTTDTDRGPQRTIEMVDRSTNQVYCIWLEGGNWQKKQGACDTALAQIDNDTNTTSDLSDSSDTDSNTNSDSATPTPSTYYYDGDGDEFGTGNNHQQSSSDLDGYVLNSDDCNDHATTVNPDMEERCNDGLDNDCNGHTDDNDPACQSSEPSVSLQDSYSAEVGQQLAFTAQTSDFNATLTYVWDYGDGATTTTAVSETSHTYTATGTYTLTVEVSSASSTASASASVEITAGSDSETCSADNLSLCDTETKCNEVGLYWYDNACHTEQNSVPTVQDVSATTTTTPVTVTLKGNDEDGEALTYSIEQPSSGSASLSGSEVTYTPNDGFTGSDSFFYAASDGKATSSSATVSITVQRPTDTESPTITIEGSDPLNLAVGDSYQEAVPDPEATASDNRDGNLTEQIGIINNVDTNATGTYAVVYEVSDSAGNSISKERTVNVGN